MATKDNIRALRLAHGMSQEDFAKIAGVTDKAVSAWEQGIREPRMSYVVKIANHFGLSKADIIDDNGFAVNPRINWSNVTVEHDVVKNPPKIKKPNFDELKLDIEIHELSETLANLKNDVQFLLEVKEYVSAMKALQLTAADIENIKKYHALDERGKRNVDRVLNAEYEETEEYFKEKGESS